jgi:non-ribosomal peptide synthetase component F
VSELRWRSVIDLWRDSCANYPEQIAVEDGLVRWTYRELEERVNGWGAQIAKLPHTASNIALQMPHQAEAIAALLGILAAGRAAVVLDPAHPLAMRVGQLNFCDATALLWRQQDAAALLNAGWVGSVIAPEDRPGGATLSPQMSIKPESIAYFHFTSGSSGGPKALALPHRTASCGVAHLQAMFSFIQTDRHALLSPLAVPASTVQVLAVLAAGATLCLFEARDRSVTSTAAWLREQRITTVQTVPSLMRPLAREVAGKISGPICARSRSGASLRP